MSSVGDDIALMYAALVSSEIRTMEGWEEISIVPHKARV